MSGPGRCVCWSAAASYFCCLWPHGCSRRHWCAVGPGCWLCPWAVARPLAVRAASFARRVASKPGQAPPPPTGTAARPCCRRPAPRPGPAAVHGHRGLALPPPTGTAARPRRRPRAPQPGPATDHGHRGLAPPPPTGTAAWPRRRPRAPRPGPAADHGHRGRALRSLRRPPHQWGLRCRCVAWRIGSKPSYGRQLATSHVILL